MRETCSTRCERLQKPPDHASPLRQACNRARNTKHIERRARRQDTLPLLAEWLAWSYRHAILEPRWNEQTLKAASPAAAFRPEEAARHEAAEWLDRDRSWKEELALALKLTEAQEQDVDTASLREAARLPAVTAAIRQEIARLARSPAPQRWMAWTGDA